MKSFSLRLFYLYLFSFVGLMITVVGFIRLVDLGMKVYVFNGADQYNYYTGPVIEPDSQLTSEEQKTIQEQEMLQMKEDTIRQRQREFSGALSMIIIGLPLYLYHWKTIQRENKSI